MNRKIVLLKKIESFIQLGYNTQKDYDINDKEEEIEVEFTNLKQKMIVNCFNHIATHWSEEHYKKCLEEWKSLQPFIIPKDSENGFKCTCGVVWTDKKFICPLQLICPSCDQYSQPYLSNPNNQEYVVKYIPVKYFKYIFEEKVKLTWILTPDLSDIDIDEMYKYSSYDDKCLISTFYKDEILDFLEEQGIKNINLLLTEDKFQYKANFEIDFKDLSRVVNILINFKTGRFKTTSIYMKNKDSLEVDEWVKVWKKGKFNTNLLNEN